MSVVTGLAFALSAVGNAAILVGIWEPTDVGVDTAKAGAGLGVTRIIWTWIGAGCL